ncbi:MAG TPA: hypothetical protein VD865_12380 [Stenotrophomonas sp.]|nr:hypothetical protein [Stenotrophomonas sp.]
MKLRPHLLALSLLLVLPGTASARDELPQVIALRQRLAGLQAQPEAADVARYERLQAEQSINAVAEAKRKEQEQALYIADRRVEIAETSVRTALARRDLARLEGTRNELLIEASRRDAARARQEAEQLRVQAQIQAEESERLRQAAEQETLARQDAEAALTSVAGKQTAKLNAAQQKAAQLAREEAELMSGAKLPASRFEARGEVFSLGADAYAGKAELSGTAAAQAKALAEYLNIGKKGRVNILAYGADAKPRGEALRDALVAAGVSASRVQVSAGKGAPTKARAAEVVVAP